MEEVGHADVAHVLRVLHLAYELHALQVECEEGGVEPALEHGPQRAAFIVGAVLLAKAAGSA